MSPLYVDPLQVIAHVVATETASSRLEAFRTARKTQLALRKAGFVIVRRRYVASGELS